jgi:putative transposase
MTKSLNATTNLSKEKIDNSLTDENHCHENAITECVDGISKNEFYLNQSL